MPWSTACGAGAGAFAADLGLRGSDSLEVKVRALLAERRQRIGYDKQLIAAVGSCL